MLDFATLLPIFWRRKSQGQKTKTQAQEHKTNFAMLPPEILLLISDFLPVSSTVSFALCSRRVLWLLGDKAFRCLRSTDQTQERKLFLTLLEKDLPDWLLCHYCIRFHPVRPDDGPEKRWRYLNEPECIRANGVVHILIGFDIQYHHVQLPMNNYRFGRAHQINLERLCYKASNTIGNANIETKIWGCIVLGELCMQANAKLRLSSPADINPIKCYIPKICPHSRGFEQRKFEFQNTFCQPCYAGRVPCVDCSKLRSCQKCSTWFLVSGKEFGNQGIELQIDIWRHFGSCETPSDSKWSSQIDRLYLPIRPRQRGRRTVLIRSYGAAMVIR